MKYWLFNLWLGFVVGCVAPGFEQQTMAQGGAQQLQLIEKNRQQPLANRLVNLRLEVDGSSVVEANLKSDAQGLVDLSPFHQENAGRLREFSGRTRYILSLDEASAIIATDAWTKQNSPLKVEFDLGALLVTGFFVDERGQRIYSPTELFPREIKDYLPAALAQWGHQLRLYQEKGADQILALNSVRLGARGDFEFYVKVNSRYRFDPLGFKDFNIMNPTFMTGKSDLTLKLVARPKPFCLYGEFIDGTDGSPVKETISITGLGVYFNGMGKSRYALFFDEPKSVSLTVAGYPYQKKYRQETVTLDVREKLQRHDFKLEPLAASRAGFKFHLKFTGIAIKQAYDFMPYLSGTNYFSQQGEYKKDNRYEFSLPGAGQYKLQLNSQRFYAEAPLELLLDHEQTLELKAEEKDTWLIVKITPEDGKPIGFPNSQKIRMHEARKNCVILGPGEEKDNGRTLFQAYLNAGETADVGGALRPDENGQVKFLLAKGGRYTLYTRFNEYQDTATPIDLQPHESKTVNVKLQRLP